MKTLIVVLVACLAVGLVLASDTQKHGKNHQGKTHEMTVEFVSADAKAKTITIKADNGETKTAPLMDKAVGMVNGLKAGSRVTLTCQDNMKGEHMGVIAIKPAESSGT
jgi:hypothetical protein